MGERLPGRRTGWKGAIVALGVLAVAFALTLSRVEAASRVAPDFTLADQHGHPFTLSHFRGRPVVLFFGYTHCPDVCPTILANLKHARDVAGPQAADTVVALVTVDPKRDTRAALGQFVNVFDPAFIGLTGTTAQLEPIYRAYHVRIEKQVENTSGYLVSHTAFVYYIGRDGHMDGFGTWNDPPDVLLDDLRQIIARR